MANNYFNFTDPVVAGTRIVGAKYNGDMAAIAAAFDRVPDSNVLYLSLLGYGMSTGTVPNVYNVTIPTGATLTGYVTGMQVTFLADKTSTGSAQLNVNGLGNKLIVSSGSVALPAGSIIAGSYYTLRYDGTNFQMQTALYALFDQAAAAAAASAAAALVSQNAAATSAAAALVSQNAAAASAAAAANSASAASGSATSAANSAASAATSATTANNRATAAANSASAASSFAASASTDATAAASAMAAALVSQNASAASATAAANSATAAANSATDAANSAASIDPSALMRKDQNLNDVASKPTSRANLEVYSKVEVDAISGPYLGQIYQIAWRGAVPDGSAAIDGQAVDVSVGSTWRAVYDAVVAGKHPTTTEAIWQADPTQRHCFVVNIGDGRMRLPDYNGVTAGSIKSPVWRGDGGSSTGMQYSGVPNLTGQINNTSDGNGYGFVLANAIKSGVFDVTAGPNLNGLSGNTGVVTARSLTFNARNVSTVFQDGLTEARANSVFGCYVIRFAGRALNAGSLDAMTLATRIEQVNTDMLARDSATNARIDYALVSVTSINTLGARVIVANPFGNSTPVEVVTEVLCNDSKWYDLGWIYVPGNGSYGVRTSQVIGTDANSGLCVRTGTYQFAAGGQDAGGGLPTGVVPSTPLTIRIHVQKVTKHA